MDEELTTTDSDRCTLITGASGAIGTALALQYAGPGNVLVLQGRRQEALEETAEACRQGGSRVRVDALALDDEAALFDWLEEIARWRLPDLVIANAGINTHARAGEILEPWEETRRLLDVNVRAPMAMASRLCPAMAERGSGQFVFMSSLAAWYGLPVTPAYSASKAALKAYAEGLRGRLARHGVGVSVVLPGYVASPMEDAMPGPKPFLQDPARAARTIVRGVARDRGRIAFPLPMAIGCQCLALLPAAASGRILGWLGYGGGER